MTYFEPTPSELLFRLGVSLVGLTMLVLAFSVRGIPEGTMEAGLGLVTVAFLAMSAGVSGRKLREFREA